MSCNANMLSRPDSQINEAETDQGLLSGTPDEPYKKCHLLQNIF